MNLAYLGLGSNLGDRLANLQSAANFLDLRAGDVVRISKVYQTEPMYVENQPAFLNAVVELGTELEPMELLEIVKAIEDEIGRIPRERFGPREIDIDLLAYYPKIEFENERLKLPHPNIKERRFVLEPLNELRPDLEIAPNLLVVESLRGDVLKQKVEAFADGILSIHSD